MNTMITDAALPELPDSDIRGKFNNPLYTMADMQAYARAAIEAALPHLATVKQSLTAAPEAGNPVSVSERERFEAGIGVGSRVSVDGHPATVTGLDPYTERFKIEWDAPKGGTMYRLREEMCPIAARQPVGEVVSISEGTREVLQEMINDCWRDEDSNIAEEIGRLITQPLYATPPAQQTADFAAQKNSERYLQLRRKVCIAGGEFHILNLRPTYVAPDAGVELDAVIDALIENPAVPHA